MPSDAELERLAAFLAGELPPDERAAVASRLEAATGQPVLQISAATNEGLRPLIMKCWAMLGRPHGDDDDE